MSYCRGIQSSAVSYISALHCPAFIFSQHSILRGSCPSIVMVRTRGGSHLRPRVRFSTPEREAPTPAPVPAPVSSLVPEAVPEEPQGFDDIKLGWDPRPLHQYHSADLGGPGPPSGPAHQARVSHPHPGLSHLQSLQLQRRHHRLSCRLLPGSGGRCSSGTPFRGTYGSTAESSIRSRITMSRYSRLIPGSGIL